jgi:hypothetical protein
MSCSSRSAFQRQLFLTSALAVPCFFSYSSRQAYAACSSIGGGTYLCSGTITTTQTVTANNAAVSMASDATIDTSAGSGNAITITGNGALSFTNTAGGEIRAAESGLEVRSAGDDGGTAGAVTIGVTKAISATNGYGILATNSGGATGSIRITAANVTSLTKDAIYALNSSSGTDLTITTSGTVAGLVKGIYARNNGTGALTLTTAAVAGTTGSGILAKNYSSASDMTITSSGAVSGALAGLYAGNFGSGALSITAVDVVGVDGAGKTNEAHGIHAKGTGTNITITTSGNVTGTNSGIYAKNLGTGSTTISVYNASGESEAGIYALTGYSTTNLTVTASGTVNGQNNGINVRNLGTGALAITAKDVTGYSNSGIFARNSGTDLTVRVTGTVTGNNDSPFVGAIQAQNFGTGKLTIDVFDVVSAGHGIFAQNQSGTDVDVTVTGTVTAADSGVYALNGGTGNLTVSTVDVTGGNRAGIDARVESTGRDLAITATGTVKGKTYGIYARNEGSGALSITAATVTGQDDDGIFVKNTSSGTDISITTSGAVTGQEKGIYVLNHGAGSLAISTTSVAGTDEAGMLVRNYSSASDLTITATGAVSGKFSGIYAANYGGGALTISVTDVTGADGFSQHNQANGIEVKNAGTSLTITSSGDVTGAYNGFAAKNLGTGATVISAVNVTGSAGNGIYAVGSYSTGDLTVTTTGAVSGAIHGIRTENDGTGSITISAHDASGGSEDGIYARTASSGASVTVTGVVHGGRHGAALNAAGPNTITITETGSLSGGDEAIDTSEGTPGSDDSVVNYGMVSGNVELGGGTNAFDNMSGGTFKSGATVNLGAGNTLTNRGDLSPGGTGTIQTTSLIGNLVQTSGGTFTVDLNADASTVDRLDITGTATLAGNIKVNPLNLINPSTNLTILSAAGGVIDNGLTARDTAVVDYTLLFPNATDVVLGDQYVNFAPVDGFGSSLLRTQNERNVGANMNAIYADGGGEIHDLQLELMKIESIQAYEEALDRLHGETYLVQVGAAVGSLHGFHETLLSCPSRLDGVALAAADDHCLWGRFHGRRTDIAQTTTTIGGGETSFGFSGGLEVPFGEGRRAGVALAVETSDIGTNNSGSADGMRYTIGAKFEKTWAALEASAGAYGGLAQYRTRREVGLGMGTARGDQDILFGGVVTRLSYAFDAGPVQIVPMIGLSATHVAFGDVREQGAGSANLDLSGGQDWVLAATPALGVVGTLIRQQGYRLNGSLKAGVSVLSGNDYSFNSRFAEAPTGVPDFVTSTKLDRAVGHVAAALELQTDSGASFKIGYAGDFGSVSRSNGGHLRAIIPF